MRKPCIAITFLTLIICADITRCAPAKKSLKTKLNPYYLQAMAAYKKLESKLPREELRAITTIGILNGAKQAEQQMERHLIDAVKDLVLSTNINDMDSVLPKIEKIEEQMNRDQTALEILTKSMDLVTKTKDMKTFNKEIQGLAEDLKAKPAQTLVGESSDTNVGKKVGQLRRHILQQMDLMKRVVDDKIDDTLDYIIVNADSDSLIGKATKVVRKRNADREEPARIQQIKSDVTEDDIRSNLVMDGDDDNDESADENDSLEDDNFFLASNNVIETNSLAEATANVQVMANGAVATTNGSGNMTLAKQEEGSPELLDNSSGGGDMPGGGGGLVGIITSLSGGEGGSDIGALIGALTGVISQLFGPGGLDIESLLSSATSLIAGLLAGNRNFGTVLGIYVGTALDGLSGGGGAINNGQFIGNFLGTVVASLSADPEDDDEPPKPLIFLQNVVSSFMEAKNRKGSSEESGERKDKNSNEKGGGSDSTAFIKHIASHIVGSVVSLILNASLGASGGASGASHSLFAGSSGGHKPSGNGNGGSKWK
ncbi:uncharacterized protein LOC106084245 [Stomoxys calcitrans]|uniref:uncharacterized protein LOC106084245 n=1 Tax=Stomoxys calcitrans TaxID=35570 RepID=UPI0027E26414|nr:uncharacterized protein LOC106084245 [Stomoxys calcitrans]